MLLITLRMFTWQAEKFVCVTWDILWGSSVDSVSKGSLPSLTFSEALLPVFFRTVTDGQSFPSFTLLDVFQHWIQCLAHWKYCWIEQSEEKGIRPILLCFSSQSQKMLSLATESSLISIIYSNVLPGQESARMGLFYNQFNKMHLGGSLWINYNFLVTSPERL